MASFHETDAETEPAILFVYLLIYLVIYLEIDSVPIFRFFSVNGYFQSIINPVLCQKCG